jgi:hypothetical protein
MGLRALVIAAVAGVFIPPQAPSNPARARDEAVEALVAEAAAVPPEFAADVLIRIATSDKLASDLEWKRELLDDAFERAAAAREPHRRTALLVSPDTRAGALLQTYDMHLDRVSLQVRVVAAMLSFDLARATELFEWIDLDLNPAGCDEVLVPAADEYYAALTQIARAMARRGALGSDARSDAFQFLLFYLWRARLPSEMPAVVKAIRGFNAEAGEASYLGGALRTILGYGVPDPRAFSTAGLELVGRMSDLADDERRAGLSPSILIQGLRDYLVGELKGARCADSISEGPIVDAFNAVLRHPGVATHGLDPLTARDTRPSKMLAPAEVESYWRTPEARRLHEQIMQLRGPDRQPLPASIRRARPWREDAEAFVVDLERWSGVREASDPDGLYQKGLLLGGLFDLAPQPELRVRALGGLVDLLRHSAVGYERPALWFLPVARLLESARGASRVELIAALAKSGQPTLALYAHLDRSVPIVFRR